MSETLDEVITAYRAANPEVKMEDYVHLCAWDLQRQSIHDTTYLSCKAPPCGVLDGSTGYHM